MWKSSDSNLCVELLAKYFYKPMSSKCHLNFLRKRPVQFLKLGGGWYLSYSALSIDICILIFSVYIGTLSLNLRS